MGKPAQGSVAPPPRRCYSFSACRVTLATDAGLAGAKARRQTSVSINPNATIRNPKVTLILMAIPKAIWFPSVPYSYPKEIR